MIPFVGTFVRAPRWLEIFSHGPRVVLRGRFRWLNSGAAARAVGVMLGVVICQQLALLGLALLACSMLGQEGLASLADVSGADRIYAGLVLGMLGHATPAGIALRLPFADVLQQVIPGLYSDSYLPSTTWIGAIFATGSSAIGAQLLQSVVNLAFVCLGSGLSFAAVKAMRASPNATRAWQQVLVISVLTLAAGVGSQAPLVWTSGSSGEMALSMVATKILGMDTTVYDQVLSHSWWVSAAINFGSVALAAGIGAGFAAVMVRLLRWAVLAQHDAHHLVHGFEWRTVVPVALMMALLASPVQHGIGFQDESGSVSQDMAIASEAIEATIPLGQPSVVTIARDKGLFVYRVDGSQQFVRGVGYNAITRDETQAQRAQRFDRDFSAIREMGANTLTGWDESVFDETLMRHAAAHGLGVILPIELPTGLAYGDTATREQLLANVSDRVSSFKDSPALRMWGLGNEVIHDLVEKRKSDPSAFAGFLVQAADVIHQIDPNHPVIYRDAEDIFIQPVARALRADGQDRPWFVYGMNFFTARLQAALTKGPARSLDQPLLISEFGPVGVRGVGRAVVYSQLWKTILANRGLVLGGCAYVWTTEGPEPLDRTFGLTDASGQPVDSSLSTLADLFRKGEADDANAATDAAIARSLLGP